jgi:hypothetical protein
MYKKTAELKWIFLFSDHFPDKTSVASTLLAEEVVVKLPPQVVRIIRQFPEKISHFGIKISYFHPDKISVIRC